jgi:hypothetical protein
LFLPKVPIDNDYRHFWRLLDGTVLARDIPDFFQPPAAPRIFDMTINTPYNPGARESRSAGDDTSLDPQHEYHTASQTNSESLLTLSQSGILSGAMKPRALAQPG